MRPLPTPLRVTRPSCSVPPVNHRLVRLAQDKRVRRAALLLVLWVPAVVILIAVREVLLPFVLALLLAYVIAPIVRGISSIDVGGRSLPRWGSVLVLYAGFAGVIWLSGTLFVPQVYREVARLAKDATDMLNQVDDASIAKLGYRLEGFFDQYNLPVRIVTPGSDGESSGVRGTREIPVNLVEVTQGMIRDAKQWLRAESALVFGQLQRVVTGVIGFVFKVFLVLMLTAFIAADSSRILEFLLSVTPVSDRDRLRELLDRIDRGLSGVVRGQLTICLINGVLTLIGLLLIQVKFAFLLATIAAVFSLVPIFGSILSTIPIVLVALSGGLSAAALALVWIVGIHALEANLLNPKIMGDAARIHPVLVVLALVVGEHFYGIVGALLAVPIASVLVTVFKAARTRAMQLDDEISTEEVRPTRPRRRERPGPRLRKEHASP